MYLNINTYYNSSGTGRYRYGFGGYEKDDSWKQTGNSYTTEFRQYDPRLGKWLSVDPVMHAMYSSYSAYDNNPVYYVDPSGADSENENKDDLNETSKTGSKQKEKEDEKTKKEAEDLKKELSQTREELSEAKSTLDKVQFASDVADQLSTKGAIKGLTISIVAEFVKQSREGKISEEKMQEYLENPEKLKAPIDEYVKDYSRYLNRTGYFPPTIDDNERRKIDIADLMTAKDFAVLVLNTNKYVRAATTVLSVATAGTVKVYKRKVSALEQKVEKLENKLSKIQGDVSHPLGGGSTGGGGAGGSF